LSHYNENTTIKFILFPDLSVVLYFTEHCLDLMVLGLRNFQAAHAVTLIQGSNIIAS